MLLAGVFLVGVIGYLLPEAWIRQWLGGNGLGASFLATLIGAISYFATMTEAPFVDTLINLGMGKGPALALLAGSRAFSMAPAGESPRGCTSTPTSGLPPRPNNGPRYR